MQPVTRRKPAPKPTDVACREQGPWRGRGDRGKPAGGGEDVRKEGSSPPTAGTVARAGSLRPWCGAHCPPPATVVHPCLALAALLSLPQRRAFPQPSPRQHSLGLFSLTCLPHRNLGQSGGEPSRGGMGSGCLRTCRPAKRQEDLPGAASRTKSSSADPALPPKVGRAV